ncbi:MAG: hypothetical protein V3T17_09805 [Pseudomonadales bacterium]
MDIDSLLSMASLSGRFNELVGILVILFNKWHIAFWISSMVVINGGGLAVIGFSLLRSLADSNEKIIITIISIIVIDVLMIRNYIVDTDISSSFQAGQPIMLSTGPYKSWQFLSTLYVMFKEDADVEAQKILSNHNGNLALNKKNIGLFKRSSQMSSLPFIDDVPDAKNAYSDYINNCTSAMLSNPQVSPQSWLAVGLMGGGGLGLPRSFYTSYDQNDSNLKRFFSDLFGIGRFVKNDVRTPALQALEQVNGDFSNVDNYKGYPIYNTYFWTNVVDGLSSHPTNSDYIAGSLFEGGKYAYPNLNTTSLNNLSVKRPYELLFYPKNCREMYEVAHMSLNEFYSALIGKPKTIQSFNESDVGDSADAVAMLSGKGASASVQLARLHEVIANERPRFGMDKISTWIPGDRTNTKKFGVMARMGSSLAEWLKEVWTKVKLFMFQFTIPAMIVFNALGAAFLITAFPFFAAMVPFVGIDIILSWFKILAVIYIASFINWFILVAGSELMHVFNLLTAVHVTTIGGNSNLTLLAALLPAIIITSITAVEIAIAYLLVMRDMSGMRRLNPGQAGFSSHALVGTASAIASVGFGLASLGSTKQPTPSSNPNPGGNPLPSPGQYQQTAPLLQHLSAQLPSSLPNARRTSQPHLRESQIRSRRGKD